MRYIKRTIDTTLEEWKNSTQRIPALFLRKIENEKGFRRTKAKPRAAGITESEIVNHKISKLSDALFPFFCRAKQYTFTFVLSHSSGSA